MSRQHDTGVDRLLEEQHKAIQSSRARIQELNKFKKEYKDLSIKLDELPKKVICPAMLPFSSKALVPGRFIHTNEVYAYIGADHFVLVSAHEAGQMVTRRISKLDGQLNDVGEQSRLVESRCQFTEDLRRQSDSGVVEIKEDYDPKAEQEWRVRHRQLLKSRQHVTAPDRRTDDFNDAALMQRLEELEREEEEEERRTIVGGNSKCERRSSLKSSDRSDQDPKQVHFVETLPVAFPTNPSADSDDSNDEVEPRSKVISFRHSSGQTSLPSSLPPPSQLTPAHLTLLSSGRENAAGEGPCASLVVDRSDTGSAGPSQANNNADEKPVSRFKSMRSAKSKVS